MDLEAGTVVANRYRITHPLGRGGMGEVYAAENIRTSRKVAVKLLRADSKSKSSAVKRFEQEARAAGTINSDYVTQVLDVGEDEQHGIVIVFELLEGESIIDRLKRTGPIPFEELFPFIEQVWMGLADAHRVGIIHRDLKPSNVFLERRPDGLRAKILDFGISKVPKEMGGETLTEMGQSLGTFSFMPPEQIGRAKTVDHRADIYACTTLIYQALSAQLPYNARNILVLVDLKTKTDPRPLSEAMERPVDPRLEAFIAKGLARNPADRFQSAVEALAAWRELRPGGTTLSPPSQVPASTPVPVSPHRSFTPPPAPPPGSGSYSSPQAGSGSYPSPQAGSGSYRPPAAPPPPQSNSGAPSYQQQPSPFDALGDRARPRGGTLAMENVSSVDQSAATRAIVRPPAPPDQPQRGSAIPSPYPPDSRAVPNAYGGSGSYLPPPSVPSKSSPPHNPFAQRPSSVPSDDSSVPSISQTMPTRVYNPNAAAQNQAAMGSGLHMRPSSVPMGQGPMQAPVQAPPMQVQQSSQQMPVQQQAYFPNPYEQPQKSSSVRVLVWFVVFAVVGFGLVALLHFLDVF